MNASELDDVPREKPPPAVKLTVRAGPTGMGIQLDPFNKVCEGVPTVGGSCVCERLSTLDVCVRVRRWWVCCLAARRSSTASSSTLETRFSDVRRMGESCSVARSRWRASSRRRGMSTRCW